MEFQEGSRGEESTGEALWGSKSFPSAAEDLDFPVPPCLRSEIEEAATFLRPATRPHDPRGFPAHCSVDEGIMRLYEFMRTRSVAYRIPPVL